MTENMKKLLEAMSSNNELREKVNAARTKEEITELAKGAGITLTEADFVTNDGKELSDDELSAAAGGGGFCFIIGGGSKDGDPYLCIAFGIGGGDSGEMEMCILFGDSKLFS